MAAFHIHEDVENSYPNGVASKKSGRDMDDKKHSKKNFLDNRGKVQALNAAMPACSKRFRLTAIDEENDKATVASKSPAVEESMIKREKENTVPEPELKEEDKEYFPDSLLYSEDYRMEIWQHLRHTEQAYSKVKPTYMLGQTDLNWERRSMLVDWLVSVADEFTYCGETLHLSVNYIDRFLSKVFVVLTKFQLVAAAAMRLASKMEEYHPLDVSDWVYLSGDSFTARQIIKMEKIILQALKFDMQPPTIYGFIQHLSSEYKMDEKTVHLAMFISELVLLEGSHYLRHLPSKLAASSIVLARHTLSKPNPWPARLEEVSGFTLKELSPVVSKQHKTLKESPMSKHQSIRKKYESEKFNKVAELEPKRLAFVELEGEELLELENC